MGKDESLVAHESSWRGRDTDKNDVVTLPALLLFEPPPGFSVAQDAYLKALQAWESEMEALEASIEAMRIKVQIGSDTSLDALVSQADKLCSMSLTASNRLLLGPAEPTP